MLKRKTLKQTQHAGGCPCLAASAKNVGSPSHTLHCYQLKLVGKVHFPLCIWNCPDYATSFKNARVCVQEHCSREQSEARSFAKTMQTQARADTHTHRQLPHHSYLSVTITSLLQTEAKHRLERQTKPNCRQGSVPIYHHLMTPGPAIRIIGVPASTDSKAWAASANVSLDFGIMRQKLAAS